MENTSLRITFLQKCKYSDLIPRSLRFRIPTNGCFDEKSVHTFQCQLLTKELFKAKTTLKEQKLLLDQKRDIMKRSVPRKCLSSIVLHSRMERYKIRRDLTNRHNKKLNNLSEEQERPLFSVKNTVVTCGVDTTPPAYVLETLALGPKNAVLDRFDPKDILSELDGLLYFCKSRNIPDETITPKH